jgi:ceramide glucosyltransferase
MHGIHGLVWLRNALLVVAVAPAVYSVLVVYAARRFFRRRKNWAAGTEALPPVSILKPVRGLDPDAYENFASYCRQNYPDYEILFAVADADDEALPVLERLVRDFPDRQIRILIGVERIGSNNKVNKLCRLVREARHDILVISDSDIRVPPGHLRTVVAPFTDPGVGAVTCVYRSAAENSPGAVLEALSNATDFQAGVLAAWLLEGVHFALGATMAVRRAALEAIGGFEALADHYSDDYETGRRIAALGYRVELCPEPVTTVFPQQSLREGFRHQVRWALTTRHSRPWGHAGLVLTFGLPWSLAAAAVAPTRALAAAYLLSYAILRAAVCWEVGVRGLGDELVRRRWYLVPLRDAVAVGVWVASFFTRRIEWRGSSFYVRNERLVPAERG